MKLKKILAATLLTGSLAVGTVGVASAATAADNPAKPTQAQLCTRAQNAWQKLKTLDERARAHQQKLTTLRDKAASEGNTELVAKIDARLAQLQERHDRIVARLKEIHDKAQGRCAVDPSTTDPSTTDPTTTAS
jgi:gas vesicle protein